MEVGEVLRRSGRRTGGAWGRKRWMVEVQKASSWCPCRERERGGGGGETEREREKRTGRRGRRGVGTQSASNGVKASACAAQAGKVRSCF